MTYTPEFLITWLTGTPLATHGVGKYVKHGSQYRILARPVAVVDCLSDQLACPDGIRYGKSISEDIERI